MPTKLKKKKPTTKLIPSPSDDNYFKYDIPKNCGYEKKFRYNLSLGTYGVPGEIIHWCIANCKHKWGWWFKNDNSCYQQWDHEHNEAFMSFNSGREAFRFWFQVGCKHYGDNDPDEH